MRWSAFIFEVDGGRIQSITDHNDKVYPDGLDQGWFLFGNLYVTIKE